MPQEITAVKVASYPNGAPSDSLSHSIPPTSTHLLICIRHGVLRFAVYLLAGAYIIAWLEGGSDFLQSHALGIYCIFSLGGTKHFFRLDVRRLLVRNGQPRMLRFLFLFAFSFFLGASFLAQFLLLGRPDSGCSRSQHHWPATSESSGQFHSHVTSRL